MSTLSSTMLTPNGCPNIPNVVPRNNLVAVVQIDHVDAFSVNEGTAFHLQKVTATNQRTGRKEPTGCQIYIQCLDGAPIYTFGRPPRENKQPEYDVCVPDRQIKKGLFILRPDTTNDHWRIEADSATTIYVNNVPLQKSTAKHPPKNKKAPRSLQYVYLDYARANHIQVHHITISVWLLQTVREIIRGRPELPKSTVIGELQKVEGRQEAWARDSYMWDRQPNQISDKSYRVIQRFTGERQIAKVFQDRDGIDQRDREMLMFGNLKTTAGIPIVRYLIATEIDGIPAVITDTHLSMASLASIDSSLPSMHPGYRFQLAAGLVKPMFSGIEFLHHNRILHGSLSSRSILFREEDGWVSKVLLTDYSNAYLVDMGDNMPVELMRHEGVEAMAVIENCCDIWALRQKPLSEWKPQPVLRDNTRLEENKYNAIQQMIGDLSANQDYWWHKTQKPHWEAFLHSQGRRKARAQLDERENSRLLKVGPVTEDDLRKIEDKWKQSAKGKAVGREQPMLLTLGHEFLDSLPNAICSSRGPPLPLPHEICSKLRSLEGKDTRPWQRIIVTRKFDFKVHTSGFDSVLQIDTHSLAAYLAVYCDVYPSLRDVIIEAYALTIAQKGAFLLPETIRAFIRQLSMRTKLPDTMKFTLEKLAAINANEDSTFTEEHDVWYHRPSQMFNVTQMHRLATSDRLKMCLSDNRTQCDNFVEVRGEPKIEGCYVPLPMLKLFTEALGVSTSDTPKKQIEAWTHDPSDFSGMSHRIVLAHRWLVGYASMSRTQDQVWHCPRGLEDYKKSEYFLSTYFGDWKVLPKPSEGMHRYLRPVHWMKYKKTEEPEARKTLSPVSVSSKSSGTPSQSRTVADRAAGAPCHLLRAIQERVNIIAEANMPFKRPIEDIDPDGPLAQLVRKANTPRGSLMRVDVPNPSFEPAHLDQDVSREVLRWKTAWEFEQNAENNAAFTAFSPEERRDLALMQANRQRVPTEVDTAPLAQNAPTAFEAYQTKLATNFRPRTAADFIPDRDRASMFRSFNNIPNQETNPFGRQSPPRTSEWIDKEFDAPLPTEGLRRHVDGSQSFYGGMFDQRGREVNPFEHQRSKMNTSERMEYEMEQARKMSVIHEQEDESIPATEVSDAEMTDVGDETAR